MAELATDAQMRMMQRLGIHILPDMTKGEAFKAIQAHMEKNKPKDITNSYSQARPTSSPPGLDSLKQKWIVRQNCKDAAVSLVVAGKISLDNWQEWAEVFERWVFRE